MIKMAWIPGYLLEGKVLKVVNPNTHQTVIVERKKSYVIAQLLNVRALFLTKHTLIYSD